MLGSWSDDARARIPPFDSIELELSALWEDVELEQPER